VSDTNKTSAVTGRNIVKQFGSGDHLVTALDGISLEIEDNEFFTKIFKCQSEQNQTSAEWNKYLEITDCKET
jgi:hypothetical protein